ncbi:hypothetical protein CABS01_03727 [Colletotrichum abscissum]|uniref:uncharacterized protein n=1 Tax=Colletotrichum abscissum TaxID=1671311 RepID=UPI0027D652C1|nr:uncharacterized protein CABS01_03727 [Colletotrichum abscissum]KAK1475450.1 hypothetical protein CABS01_03727 [Colletotrichum abscissum]
MPPGPSPPKWLTSELCAYTTHKSTTPSPFTWLLSLARLRHRSPVSWPLGSWKDG